MTANSNPDQTRPATITVSTSAELEAAIRQLAGDGGTVLLDGDAGPYSINISGVTSDHGMIHLRPLDPGTPPVIASMELSRTADISVDGMVFETGTRDGRQDIRIMQCRNIEITNNTMKGVAEGYLTEADPDASTKGDTLMLMRNSREIVFSDNTVSNYFGGLGILDSNDVTIENNFFSRLQADGIQGGGWQDVVISGNHLHDFYGTTQTINHSDMIQIWGRHTDQITRNVEISGNFLDSGGQAATQGIFIQNEDLGRADSDTPGHFENISITENVVHNGVRNGISVGGADGVEISNNTVLFDSNAHAQYHPDGPMGNATPWILMRDVLNGTATGNIVENIALDNTSGAGVHGNAEISYDERSSAFYVDAHFTNWDGESDLDARDFLLRSDSTLLANGSGAQPLLFGVENVDGQVAVISAQSDLDVAYKKVLTAGVMTVDGTWVDPADMDIRWILSDGTVLEGDVVSHIFDAAGSQAVTLEVTTPDGAVLRTERTIAVEDPMFLHLDFDGPLEDRSNFDTALDLRGSSEIWAAEGREGGGYLLSNKTAIDIDRKEKQLFGLDKFSIEMDFNPRSLGDYGEILSQHSVMKMFVTAQGGFGIRLQTDEGNFLVKSAPGVLQVDSWQKIGAHYDDATGTLSLGLDGEIIAETEASGTTVGSTPWGTTIGRTWANVADAVIDDLVIARHLPETDQAPEDTTPPPVKLIDFGFDGNLDDASGFDTEARGRKDPDEMFVSVDGRVGVDLGAVGAGQMVDISRDTVQLSELDAFDIDITLALDKLGERGGLLTLHTIFDLDVMADGALRFRLATDEGTYWLGTDAGALSDIGWHDVKIRYRDDTDQLSIHVDDAILAETYASGTTAELTWWPMVLGEHWGNSADAVVDQLAITTPTDVAVVEMTL